MTEHAPQVAEREITSDDSARHGHNRRGARSPTYVSWRAMIQRCTTVTFHAYHRYGGRGITVCERWRNSFAAFLADMGERPAGATLDRIDVNGNYEPTNCRWLSSIDQVRSRTTTKLTAEIAAQIRHACASGASNRDVAREFGCHVDTVCKIKRGHQWKP